MDWNRFDEFEQLKCIILDNIVNFAFFSCISALNSAKIRLFCALWSTEMTPYGFDNVNNQKHYGLEPF